MREMIGNPDVFAVEFEIKTRAPDLMGYAQLWIQGLWLGDFKVEVNLLGVSSDVEGMLCNLQTVEDPDFLALRDRDLFRFVYNGEFDNSLYLILSTDNFNDAYSFAFAVKDEMHFFWKLAVDAFHDYPAEYPRGVVHKKVPIKAVQEVAQALREAFKDFLKP